MGLGDYISFLSFLVWIWMACFTRRSGVQIIDSKVPPSNYCRGYMGICDPSQEGISYTSPTKKYIKISTYIHKENKI